MRTLVSAQTYDPQTTEYFLFTKKKNPLLFFSYSSISRRTALPNSRFFRLFFFSSISPKPAFPTGEWIERVQLPVFSPGMQKSYSPLIGVDIVNGIHRRGRHIQARRPPGNNCPNLGHSEWHRLLVRSAFPPFGKVPRDPRPQDVRGKTRRYPPHRMRLFFMRPAQISRNSPFCPAVITTGNRYLIFPPRNPIISCFVSPLRHTTPPVALLVRTYEIDTLRSGRPLRVST